MDKVYEPRLVEERLYKQWEEKGYFKPEVNPGGKPYCIILPPPNANGYLHFGHAMFVIEDILIRFHRMKGEAVLWLPGTDHAGFETQFVFEKQLQSQSKSRFDYSQEELYSMIWDFVKSSGGKIENQLRRLGFSLDWSREKYTLDPEIVKLVYKTFKKMYDEGLIYRGFRLVHYCTKDGTSFSDLEVVHEERKSPLYYVKYGPLVLATTRPETKFGDTAVAVNPKDKRYKKFVGKEIEIETVLGKAKIKVISDEYVDLQFGTGVVKITPAHDFNDYEVAQRHNLPLKQVINYDGTMNEHAGKFAGMYVKKAREAIITEMKQKELIEKIDEEYVHRIGVCYKCKTVLEPLPMEQWFVKVKSFTEKAIAAVKSGEVKIFPKNFETLYFQWLENLRDWNISRQIVWGIRIPAWKCLRCHPELVSGSNNRTMEQSSNDGWVVTDGSKPEKCLKCGSKDLEQDTDTFDTWFSSGQWPVVTLKTSKQGDFERFYPTSVMETGYDILKAWVSRMVMLGIYSTTKVPFTHVVLHGLVNDPYGKKMSKSKGNVVNPLELVEQYGADAVRMALVYGTALGHDQAMSYGKLDAMKKFSNKIWNIARFIEMKRSSLSHPERSEGSVNASRDSSVAALPLNDIKILFKTAKNDNDKEWIEKTQDLSNEITIFIDKHQFNLAAERLYEYIWHEFADIYIEDVKNRLDDNSYLILYTLYIILLKLLHPFMPFVTEEIYQKLGNKDSIMISSWPV